MKQSLYRFTCDECETEVITEEVPRGWLRILSTGVGSSGRMNHRGDPAAVWTPTSSVALGRDNPPHWCSVPCMLAHVERAANEALELAKLRIR